MAMPGPERGAMRNPKGDYHIIRFNYYRQRFSNVFEEVLGLPLNQDIELASGTTSIAKASYRIAPAKRRYLIKEIILRNYKKYFILRDTTFVSRFWGSFLKVMGTRLHLSMSYHPQTERQAELVNQIFKDMLRACALDFEDSWEMHLPLVELAYNNNYHKSINMAPYGALSGKLCKPPVCWLDLRKSRLLGTELF